MRRRLNRPGFDGASGKPRPVQILMAVVLATPHSNPNSVNSEVVRLGIALQLFVTIAAVFVAVRKHRFVAAVVREHFPTRFRDSVQ